LGGQNFDEIYYDINKYYTIELDTTLGSDQVLKTIAPNGTQFIPRQRQMGNKIIVETDENFSEAGHYRIQIDGTMLQTIAMNERREESKIDYLDTDQISQFGLQVKENMDLSKLTTIAESNELWPFFVLAALFFLICEVIILKV
jgi:hypothetical protein